MMQMTVTLGDVLTIAGFIVTATAVYVRVSERLTRLETKIDPVWQWFLKLDDEGRR